MEQAIRVTEPCSSASQVMSEDSDLYEPLLRCSSTAKSKIHGTKVIFKSLRGYLVILSLYYFFSIVDFGVHFVTLDKIGDTVICSELPSSRVCKRSIRRV